MLRSSVFGLSFLTWGMLPCVKVSGSFNKAPLSKGGLFHCYIFYLSFLTSSEQHST
jgi:hypothetical protein